MKSGIDIRGVSIYEGGHRKSILRKGRPASCTKYPNKYLLNKKYSQNSRQRGDVNDTIQNISPKFFASWRKIKAI
jgi:hypothetical protein